jgi:hypothetical protein
LEPACVFYLSARLHASPAHIRSVKSDTLGACRATRVIALEERSALGATRIREGGRGKRETEHGEER